MEQTKYDVFISYSRKDYVKDDVEIPNNPITAIMDCFDQNGVSYWVDKKGIYSGQEFVEVIADAIANSKMLVFVSSVHSNESRYTAGEILEALDGDKLIIPVRIDDCSYSKKFRIPLRPLDYIDYKARPNTALPELLRTVNKEKERIRLLEDEQNEILLKEQKKKEIAAGIIEFQRLIGEQDFRLRSLYSKSKDIGVKTKKCPVCDKEMLVDVPYCESCGWSFASLYGVYSVDGESLHDEKHLRIVRGLWQDLIAGKDSQARLEEIAAILEDERKKKEMYSEQARILKETAHSLEQEKQDQQKLIRDIKQELKKKACELAVTQNKLNDLNTLLCEMEERRKVEKQRFAEEQKREAERKAEEERKRREEVHRPNEITFTVDGVSFKMIRVEGGSFMMGAPDNDPNAMDFDKPQHHVTLSDYYIGETQVTQALWKAVMGDNPSYWKGNSLPVDNVSWEHCQEFIKQLNKKTGKFFRLPTETEWEYAARGGRKSQGFKYAGSNDIDKVAWYGRNSGRKAHPVKQKDANELGLYDMSGNVGEWCQDLSKRYSDYAETNPTDPSTGGPFRIVRGGSVDDMPKFCQVTTRLGNRNPKANWVGIGFRLALVYQ